MNDSLEKRIEDITDATDKPKKIILKKRKDRISNLNELELEN